MSADPAMEWLALARDEPEVKQLPLSAFTVYCRHLLITQSMPNAPAFLQQTSAGRDADAELVRRLLAQVRQVEAALEHVCELVQNSVLARFESGKVCLASVRRALDITPPVPSADGVCCLTGIGSHLVSVTVHTPRSQTGTQKETFVVANFLWAFLAAWALIGMAPGEVARLSQAWLATQRGALDNLEDVPTQKHLQLFTSLNQALRLVQRTAACPGFIV